MEEIVQRLKAYMELEGHTSSSMANALKMNRSTLVHILNGRNKPKLQLIQKLCAFDDKLDLRYILTGERSKKNNAVSLEGVPVKSVKAPANPSRIAS